MIKDCYFCWASDFSKETGEGQLARLFIERNYSFLNTRIFTPKSINTKKKNLNNFFKYKYVSPFIGIIICWFFFLKKKKTIYINYLPLWNFLIFLLLPPKTILGPITGGSLHNSKNIIRKFIFPLFYFVSKILIYLRYKKLYFTTDLLKKYFNQNFINKNHFNYVLNKIKKKEIKMKKDIDFIIYYRQHKNKIHNFPYNLIKKIKSFGLKIHVVGHRLNITGVYNHGYKKNYLVQKLLARSRYSICSQENLFSFFTIECINHNVKLLADNSFKDPKIKFYKKFNFINFKNDKLFYKKFLENSFI